MQAILILTGVAGVLLMLEAIRRVAATDTDHPGTWTLAMAAGYTLGTLALAAASSAGGA